ncbi:hypothetical protein GOBAR_DD33208 [Gossypium barbadense]|nr:hypothetical protein GOBAR_DD33208 [Gossypium barbadense]
MQSMKDAAASAKAGMEKAKASMQEKVNIFVILSTTFSKGIIFVDMYFENLLKWMMCLAGYNIGDTGGYGGTGGHDNRGYPTAGSGYDTGRQDDLSSMGFGGDTGGAYGTTGNQDFPSAAPNNAGTRRSTRGGTQDDPYYRSY